MRSSSLNGGGFILHNFLHKIKPILKRNGLFVPEFRFRPCLPAQSAGIGRRLTSNGKKGEGHEVSEMKNK
jgi:hypothetical protein